MMKLSLLHKLTWVLILLAGSTRCLYAEMAPDFTLPRIDNQQEITLSSLRGKVVYVDFWASWCGPCAVSLPALQSLYSELHPQGFEIIAINLDASTADAEKFLKSLTISYPVVIDLKQKTPEAYKIAGMPTAFLIDRNGSIHSTHTGFNPGDENKLGQEIKQLLLE